LTDRLPLLLVPGLGCDERLFAHQLAHLGDVTDARFAGVPAAADLDTMAAAVLDAAPPHFALAGLSMGGYIALAVQRRAPERVAKLALLDTKADLDPPEVTAGREQAIAEIEAGNLAAHIETRLPVLLGSAAFNDPNLREVTRAMALAVGPARYAAQQRAIMGRADSLPGLAAVACPTLVLCGREDALTPLGKHVVMADAIPGARLAVLEQCGHLATIEQPVAVTALLRDWLVYDR
jgi:pimeloyl-ACP methyl ester carboxylesterase